MSERVAALRMSEAVRNSIRRNSAVIPIGGAMDQADEEVADAFAFDTRSRSESTVHRSAKAGTPSALMRTRSISTERKPTPPASPFNSARRDRTGSIALAREGSGLFVRDRSGSLILPTTPSPSNVPSHLPSEPLRRVSQRNLSQSQSQSSTRSSRVQSDLTSSSPLSMSVTHAADYEQKDRSGGKKTPQSKSPSLTRRKSGSSSATDSTINKLAEPLSSSKTKGSKQQESVKDINMEATTLRRRKSTKNVKKRAHNIVFSACPICYKKVMNNSIDAHIKGCTEGAALEWTKQHWYMSNNGDIRHESQRFDQSTRDDSGLPLTPEAIHTGQFTAMDESLAAEHLYIAPPITEEMKTADPRIEPALQVAKIFGISLCWRRHLVIDVLQLGSIPTRLKCLCCFGGLNPYARVYFGPLELFDQDADGENPLPPLLAISDNSDQQFDTMRCHLWLEKKHERNLVVFVVLREGTLLLNDVPVGQVAIDPHKLKEGEWSEMCLPLHQVCTADDPPPPLVPCTLRARLRLSKPCLDMFTFTAKFRSSFKDFLINDISGKPAFKVKRAGISPVRAPMDASGGFVLCDRRNIPLLGGEFQPGNFSVVLWRVAAKALQRDAKKKPLTPEEQQKTLLESLLFVIGLRTTQTQLLLTVRTLEGEATSLVVRHELETGEGSFRVERRGEGTVALRMNDSGDPECYGMKVAVHEDVPLMLAACLAVEYLLDRAGLHIGKDQIGNGPSSSEKEKEKAAEEKHENYRRKSSRADHIHEPPEPSTKE